MVQELLEYGCGKSFISISLKDVILNEKPILFEIKKAITNGATKHLYYNEVTSEKSLESFHNYTPKPRLENTTKQKEVTDKKVEVRNYFEGFEIL